MTTCSTIMLLKEMSEVYSRNTVFKITKDAKIYCFWQGFPHFVNSFSRNEL